MNTVTTTETPKLEMILQPKGTPAKDATYQNQGRFVITYKTPTKAVPNAWTCTDVLVGSLATVSFAELKTALAAKDIDIHFSGSGSGARPLLVTLTDSALKANSKLVIAPKAKAKKAKAKK